MSIITLNQFGLIPGHNILIDSLKYQYQTSAGYNYTNKLRSVTDASFNSQNLGDFKDNESTASNDYLYNRNGNLVRDNNKYIAFVNYNHLNLPVSINIANHTGVTGGVIQYKYDALGNKQEKIVTELVNNTSCTTTTYYMGEVVYEKREGYPGAEGLVKLQLISNEEGRSIYDTATPAFHYQYMMKDHLGNVRMLLNAEEQPQLSYPNCDFEQEHLLENETYYLNTNINLTTPPPQFNNSQGTGAQCQLIKNNDAPIGVGKLLKVMATDEVGVKTDYYIPASTVDNTGANPMQNLIVSIISILNNTSYTGSMHGAGTAVGESFAHDVPLNTLLQQQGPANPSNLVKAYLNILFFDAQFNFICQQSQYQQLSVMGSSQTVTLLGSSMIKAPANGYAYIYVSNESRNPVYIDNFQVVHKPGRIVEETHYYPFGLTIAGISSKAVGSLENKKKWNVGSELNKDFDINLYETFYRSLDPQIGRFWQVDPKPKENESPFVSMGNNPISNVDPKGDYFFGLFGSTSEQRKSARAFAEQTGGDVKNITSKNVSVKFAFKAGEGDLNVGVAETKFSRNGAPNILGKEVKSQYNALKNGWGRIAPSTGKFERIPASGRVEMVDDPITTLGPGLIRGLISKLGTTAVAAVAGGAAAESSNNSLSVLRLTSEGENFIRYESSNSAFTHITPKGGVTPGTFAAPASDGLIPLESRISTYNLPTPEIPRPNVNYLDPPTGTPIIGPRPVSGGTGNEVIFPFGF